MIGFRTSMLAAIAGLGLALLLPGLAPTAVYAQGAEARQSGSQGAAAAAAPQRMPTAPTAQQQRLRQQRLDRGLLGPRVPTGESARRSSALAPTPAPGVTAPQQPGPPAPSDFVVYRSHDQAPFAGQFKSEVNEPSVGIAGPVVFV